MAIVESFVITYGGTFPYVPSVSPSLRSLDTANGTSVAEIDSVIGVEHEVYIPLHSDFDPIEQAKQRYQLRLKRSL